MDWLTAELVGVILLLLIALGILLRLAAEEILDDINTFRKRNRWRKRYKKHKHK